MFLRGGEAAGGHASNVQRVVQSLHEPSIRPVSSTRNDGASAEDGGPDLPIEGYARLSVGEISDNLGELSAGGVEKLKEYDIKNKNYHCLVERSDRSLA